MTHLVFVYGTLKKNCRNTRYLDNSDFIDTAYTTDACWNMVELWSNDVGGSICPGVVIGGQGHINGEIYRISDETLTILDELEELGKRYIRKKINTSHMQAVWMYVHTDESETRLHPNHIVFDIDTKSFTWVEN